MRILQRDAAAVADVARDPAATRLTAILVVLSGPAYAIGTFSLIAAVFMPVWLLFFMSFSVGVSHVAATCLGGKGQYIQLFRVQGLTLALFLVSAVPVVGPLLASAMGVLHLALLVNAIKVVHQLPLPRAISALVIPFVIFSVVAAVFMFTIGFDLLRMLVSALRARP